MNDSRSQGAARRDAARQRLAFLDASNLVFRQAYGDEKRPDLEWLFAVETAVLRRLANPKTILIFDASVWGWVKRVASEAEAAHLEGMRRDGVLTVAPTKIEADPLILRAARKHAGVVVSNDDYRNGRYRKLRVGVPLLRVAEVLDEPMPSQRLHVYRQASDSRPAEVADRDVLRGWQAPPGASPAPAPRSGGTPAPADLTPAEVAEQLSESFQGRDTIGLAVAAQVAQQALGPALSRLVKQTTGRKQGAWRRFCTQHLPGWSVIRLSNAQFALQRAPTDVPPARAAAPAAARPPEGPAEPTLADLEACVAELVASGTANLGEIIARVRDTLGHAATEGIAAAHGVSKKGRWRRFFTEVSTRWTIGEDAKGGAILVDAPQAPSGEATATTSGPRIASPDDFLAILWRLTGGESIGLTHAIQTLRRAGYHWDQREWGAKKLSVALARSAVDGVRFERRDNTVLIHFADP